MAERAEALLRAIVDSVRDFLLGALSAFAMLSLASAASAETPWERAHPRRDEVVDRLQNQTH